MVLPRSSALRSILRSNLSQTSRATIRGQAWQNVNRRGYSSGGHSAKGASSDLPWMIGSVAVTVPACYWLLQSSPNKGHGHDEHADEHSEDHEEKEDEGLEETEDEDSGDDSSEGKPEDSDKEDDTESSTDDDKSIEDDGGKNRRVRYPDAKGGMKLRSESKASVRLGEADSEEQDPSKGDKAAASKNAGDFDTQSGKQEGLSNTDTKHSTDIANDSTKSKKGEGTPETSKSKGTVDAKRPQK